MSGTFYKLSILCLALNALTIIAIVALQSILPPVVPLFYGLPISEDQLVKSIFITIPPLISSVLIVMNSSIVKFTNDLFITKIFAGMNIGTLILSTISVSEIILLIGKI